LPVLNTRKGALVIGLLGCVASGPVWAQTVGTMTAGAPVRGSRYETRAQLDSEAKVAERQGRSSEAFLLRSRLQQGDFQEGDRIVLTLEINPGTTDTLQVRGGKMLQMARMGELSLDGVLRSELTETLRRHLAKYLTNPNVRATPLLPIAVLGTVSQPGYYYTTADVVLRDVLMRAGPRGESDINRAVVRRAGETIWNSSAVRIALTDGLSLDRLHLRAGDELYIPERRHFPLGTVLAVLSTTSAVALVLLRH
jgi:hypothetical protein